MFNSAYIVNIENDVYCTNEEGKGVFKRKADGTWQQLAGTLQAPGRGRKFASENSFRTYVKRHFRDW